MIGQDRIRNAIVKNTSRSVVLVGDYGSGKTAIAQYFSNYIGANFILVETLDVETIKDIVYNSRYSMGKNVYCFEHIESMSEASQNILLKTLEEGNKEDFFIFNTSDVTRLISTIISRSVVYKLDAYSEKELLEYSKTRCGEIDLKYCKTPGDLEYKNFLIKTGIYDKLIELTKKIYEHINQAVVGNVFNIIRQLEIFEFDKKMALWVINVLIEHYQTCYPMIKICTEYRYHIMYNNTDFKRTFEQMLVMLNE